uniref:Uncharacterized protein n=1 Tax=Arundo donax TaxID=35708 RepID=A0A0A9C239_ARUDO
MKRQGRWALQVLPIRDNRGIKIREKCERRTLESSSPNC